MRASLLTIVNGIMSAGVSKSYTPGITFGMSARLTILNPGWIAVSWPTVPTTSSSPGILVYKTIIYIYRDMESLHRGWGIINSAM